MLVEVFHQVLFEGGFDKIKLDFENVDRERNRKFVLKVLKKMVYFSNGNLQKKVDCLSANKTSQEYCVYKKFYRMCEKKSQCCYNESCLLPSSG